MTISRLPTPVPKDLPAARLFLDDIEEIVQLLLSAGEVQHTSTVRTPVDWPPLEMAFSVGDRICDRIEELPQITKSTKNLIIQVMRGSRFHAVLVVDRFAELTTHGLRYDEQLAVFYRVEDVFKQRRLRWHLLTLENFRNAPRYTLGLGGVVIGFVFALMGTLVSKGMHLRWGSAIAIGGAVIVCLGLSWGLTRGTTVIFRNFSEQEELREKKRAGIVVEAVKLFVAFLFGMLTLYLKHKYWP